MASQASSLRLKYIDKHTTYSFSFEDCYEVYEWSVGTSKVVECVKDSGGQSIVIDLDHVCTNLEAVVRYIKKYKEDKL